MYTQASLYIDPAPGNVREDLEIPSTVIDDDIEWGLVHEVSQGERIILLYQARIPSLLNVSSGRRFGLTETSFDKMIRVLAGGIAEATRGKAYWQFDNTPPK